MKHILALLLLLLALLPVSEARAVPCVLLNRTNGIILFDSTTPGTTSGVIPITGAAGFDFVGIDVRTTVQTVGGANPGKGTVWAFALNATDNGQVFVINTTTGAATAVGGLLPVFPNSSGDNAWVFAHNPGTDRFRITNFQQNYEFNPNNGVLTTQTSFSTFPNSNGSAFETASFGENPAIFFVDQDGDKLYTSAAIQNGTYTEVGPLGVSFSTGVGLDIFAGLTVFACDDAGTAKLFSVNRTTGATTLLGAIGGNPAIRALTITPTTFPPTLPVSVRVSGPKRVVTPLTTVTLRGTAKCEAGINKVEFQVGKGKARKAKGTKRWSARIPVKPGITVVSVRATGKNLIRSKPARVTIVRE